MIEADGTPVDLSKLTSGYVPNPIYREMDMSQVKTCHDVYIKVENSKLEPGLLLVRRREEPAEGLLWPVGGKILRGVKTEESLRIKAKQEVGLDLEKIIELGFARFFSNKDPLGHERGTDAFGHNYYAIGIGKIKLNKLHEDPTIITPEMYNDKFRDNLHPYMNEFMDKAMEILTRAS